MALAAAGAALLASRLGREVAVAPAADPAPGALRRMARALLARRVDVSLAVPLLLVKIIQCTG